MFKYIPVISLGCEKDMKMWVISEQMNGQAELWYR